MPKVDLSLCIGCGTCESTCPDCFELDDDMKSHVKKECKADCCDMKQVVEDCPVQAISL